MASIYLSARYGRRAELSEYGDQLQASGHIVTSQWVAEWFGINKTSHQIIEADDGHVLPGSVGQCKQMAVTDFYDIRRCELLICFTEPPSIGFSRGGRHVELGMAIALGKQVVAIGHYENVFHCLEQVQFFESWEGFSKSGWLVDYEHRFDIDPEDYM